MNIRPTDFDAQVVGCADALSRFAKSLCRDDTRAQDLVQDTILRAMMKFESFEQGTNLKGWLFTIMRNDFLSQLRKRKREVEDVDGIMAGQLVAAADQDIVWELKETRKRMRLLPTEYRKVIELAGLMGYSYEETSEALGVPVGTIKSRLNRAREFLETGFLKEEEEFVPPPAEVYVFNPHDVVRLYQSGKSVSEIAAELPGATRSQVMDVILDRKLKPRKA